MKNRKKSEKNDATSYNIKYKITNISTYIDILLFCSGYIHTPCDMVIKININTSQ